MGKLRVYYLKTLNKLSIYSLGNTPSAPSVSSWMEDEFGRDILDAIRSNLRDDANSYWTDMYTKGEIPKPWGSTGFERKENFRIIMEGKYPWLRLCNGHWKARQVWINCLTQWKKTNLPKVSDTTPRCTDSL